MEGRLEYGNVKIAQAAARCGNPDRRFGRGCAIPSAKESPAGTPIVPSPEGASRVAGCSLPEDAQTARMNQLRSGLFREMLSMEEAEDGLKLEFADTPETAQELERFIRFERTCCASLRIGLSRDTQRGSIILELEGPGDLLRALRRVGNGREKGRQ